MEGLGAGGFSLGEGKRPVRQPARRLPWSKREEADGQVEKMLNAGVIETLTVIDLRSRYAWVVPLKNKTGNTLMLAFPKKT